MPRLLQEALWLGSAGQEDRAHSEGRQVVLVGSDPGWLIEGPRSWVGSAFAIRSNERLDRNQGLQVNRYQAPASGRSRAMGDRFASSERLYSQLHRLAPSAIASMIRGARNPSGMSRRTERLSSRSRFTYYRWRIRRSAECVSKVRFSTILRLTIQTAVQTNAHSLESLLPGHALAW